MESTANLTQMLLMQTSMARQSSLNQYVRSVFTKLEQKTTYITWKTFTKNVYMIWIKLVRML